MNRLFLFAANLLIINVLGAQNATISGRISDAQTGAELPGATVRTAKNGTATDENGDYVLSLAAGEHVLIFSFTGFDPKTEKVNLRTGEKLVLNIQLGEAINLLNTATITAGKFEKPLGEVTVSLEVIKPKFLENMNATSVDAALDRVPGVNMIDGQANIRGGSGYSFGAGSRVLLLIDDMPALQADAGLANWSDVPVENTAQIEVLKGAASALYGSSAMNGIINVRTGFAKNEPETKAAIFYQTFFDPKDDQKKWWGNDNSYTRTNNDSFLVNHPFTTGLSFGHKQKFGKLDLVFSSYGLLANSIQRDNYKRYLRVSPNFRYRMNDRLTVGLNLNFNLGKSSSFFLWQDHLAGAYQAGLNSVTRSLGRLRYTIDPSVTYFDQNGNKHKFLTRYYGIINKNDRNQANSSGSYYGEYQFQKEFENNVQLTAGIVGSQSNITAELYGDTTYRARNIAAYYQIDKKWFRRLNTSLGVRYEYNSLTSPEILQTDVLNSNNTLCKSCIDTIAGGKFSEGRPVFRFGLNYEARKGTFLRASIGQGYRFPTIAEKFITTDFGLAQVLPNAKLISETGWTGEIGLKQGFRVSDWQGFIDFTGFISEYSDMMEFTFEILQCTQNFGFIPAFRSQNIGNTRIRGLEASLNGLGKVGSIPVSVMIGHTYIQPKFRDWVPDDTLSSSVNYNVLKYRFRHAFKGNIDAEYRKIHLGATVTHNSNMEAIDRIFDFAIPGVAAFRKAHNKGYTVIELRTAFDFSKKGKLSLLVSNLLNEEYIVRPAQLEAPRSATLRLDWKF